MKSLKSKFQIQQMLNPLTDEAFSFAIMRCDGDCLYRVDDNEYFSKIEAIFALWFHQLKGV